MNQETHLLPCPFCGGKDISEPSKQGPQYKLKCHTCQVVISDDRKDKVISKWNMRNVVCVGGHIIYFQPRDTSDNILYPVSAAHTLFESIAKELSLFDLPLDKEPTAWTKAAVEMKLIWNNVGVLYDFLKTKHKKKQTYGNTKARKGASVHAKKKKEKK